MKKPSMIANSFRMRSLIHWGIAAECPACSPWTSSRGQSYHRTTAWPISLSPARRETEAIRLSLRICTCGCDASVGEKWAVDLVRTHSTPSGRARVHISAGSTPFSIRPRGQRAAPAQHNEPRGLYCDSLRFACREPRQALPCS
jgi:hypothetical protein